MMVGILTGNTGTLSGVQIELKLSQTVCGWVSDGVLQFMIWSQFTCILSSQITNNLFGPVSLFLSLQETFEMEVCLKWLQVHKPGDSSALWTLKCFTSWKTTTFLTSNSCVLKLLTNELAAERSASLILLQCTRDTGTWPHCSLLFNTSDYRGLRDITCFRKCSDEEIKCASCQYSHNSNKDAEILLLTDWFL